MNTRKIPLTTKLTPEQFSFVKSHPKRSALLRELLHKHMIKEGAANE
jgi:hypothetical protein